MIKIINETEEKQNFFKTKTKYRVILKSIKNSLFQYSTKQPPISLKKEGDE